MNTFISSYKKGIAGGLLLFSLAACKKNFTDPSGPSSSQAFSTPGALANVAVGLQNWYSIGRIGQIYNTITADGLLTNQLYVVNAGNTDEAQLGQGAGNVQNTNAVVTQLWTVSNKIIYDADSVLRQTARIVPDKNYAAGLIAYTSIFKAMAMGNLAMFWDHVPASNGSQNVQFVTSNQGFLNAAAVADNALTAISADSISTNFLLAIPSSMTATIITNTLYALKARYLLLAGNYTDALTAAGKVNLTVKSAFAFNTVNTNPIFSLATSSNNIFQPVDSAMGLPVGIQPDLADKREPFYIVQNAKTPRFRINGFFNSNTTSIPIYLPGEIMLIMAECYAQQNDLANGNLWVDKVITKQPGQDVFGVGAGLPAPADATTQADLLTRIYMNRCIELFMSGTKLADERRFNRPVAERKRTWLPYPFVERNGNVNTPPDPSF